MNEPTRKNNILDKIFTNCRALYESPTILAPVGKSDHNCVLLKPKHYCLENKAVSKVVNTQALSESVLDNLADKINSIPYCRSCSNAQCENVII